MDIISSKYSDSEESIHVVVNLLAKEKYTECMLIANEFKQLGINKVKDLAKLTTRKISQINLGGDPLVKLNEAIQLYDQLCAEQINLAKSEYDKQNFIKTQEICERMFSLHPSNLNVLLLLAGSYYKCEKYDKSIEYLNKARIINPKCAEVLNNLGSNYLKKSDIKLALGYYYSAVCKKKEYTDGWINLVETLASVNDNTADKGFKMFLIFKPELYMFRNNYGTFLRSLNRLNEAEWHYKIAIESNPEFSEVWKNLGDVYFCCNKILEANKHYVEASKMDPKCIKTLNNLGVSYLKLKEYRKAIDTFQNALQLSKENIFALRNLADVYFRQKNISLAIDIYKKCLEFHPKDLDANYNLGLLYIKYLEDFQEAEKYLKTCIELHTQKEEVYKCLYTIYQKQGKNKYASEICILLGDLYFDKNDYKNATSIFLYSLFLDPESVNGHWKLGLTMYKMGHLDSALRRYRKAIELRPNFPDAYCDCGIIYDDNNIPRKAVECYQMALKLDPYHFNALYNLAIVKEKLGELDDVIEIYKQMLEFDVTERSNLHFDLANIYIKIGNVKEALLHYREVSTNNSICSDVNITIGNILVDLKQNDEALTYFYKSIKQNPMSIVALSSIVTILENNDNIIAAINGYEKLLKISPDFPEAYCNMVLCLQKICNWNEYQSRINKFIEIVHKQLSNDHCPYLYPHNYLLYPFSNEDLKRISSKYAEQCIVKSCHLRKSEDYIYRKSFSSNQRLRVGYVTSELCDHPTSEIMQYIIQFHDKTNIELFYYLLSPDDKYSSWSKVSTESGHSRDISNLSIVDAADQINKDGIHILVNINCFSKGVRNEIFALQPAPIQVIWLGYPGTSGASFIDYLITDKICSPSEHKQYYTEKLAYMNQTVFIGNHKEVFSTLIPRVEENTTEHPNRNIHPMNNVNFCVEEENFSSKQLPLNNTITCIYSVEELPDNTSKCYTREMFKLPVKAIVYCNFSPLYNIEPSTFHMWISILKSVPNSVLWLLRFHNAGEDNLRAFATSLNFDSSRLIFSDLEPKAKYMRQLQLADIFLDTPFCNGHTTCLDALWAGTPVVTLIGETFGSRVTASQLTTFGFTNMIAQNKDEYIDIAIKLGSDKLLLNHVRNSIWDSKSESKLFDCKAYAKELETIYKDIWSNYLSDNQMET